MKINNLFSFAAISSLVLVGAVAHAELVINEICYKNTVTDDGTGSLTSDWIELYNNGTASLDIVGYSIGLKKDYATSAEKGKLFTLPSYEMSPGEFLVVFFDKDLPASTVYRERTVGGVTKSVPYIRSNAFNLGTTEDNFGEEVQTDVRLFAADSEHTRLQNWKGTDLVECLEGGKRLLDKNATWGYLWDGNLDDSGSPSTLGPLKNGSYAFDRGTPWEANAGAVRLSAPTLSKPSGRYAAAPQVAVSRTDKLSTTIYYTLDGSDPRTSATRLAVASGKSVSVPAREAATAESGAGRTNAWIRTSPAELEDRVPGAGWRAPIGSVAAASVLRAVANCGPVYSAEADATYFVGSGLPQHDLPVVALVADPDDLFSDDVGIYVPGKPYQTSGYGSNRWGKNNANYYYAAYYGLDDELEFRSHFDLIESGDATSSLSFDMGFGLHGGATRAIPQKAVYAQLRGGEYGTKEITSALIPERGVQTYKRFLLRSNGNDWYGPYTEGVSTMMKDAVFHRLVADFDMGTLAYRPAVVYLNGDYWGIHNIRESVDKHYFRTRYGLDSENIDLLTQGEDPDDKDKIKISRIDGDKQADEDYEGLLDTMDGQDQSTEAGYAVVTNAVDVWNYADYIIAETFYANTDWPGNNCDFWRAHSNQTDVAGAQGDGRWRWIFYDLDLAGLAVDSVGGVDRNMLTYLTSKKMDGKKEPAFLFNRLLTNADWKDGFIARYQAHLNHQLHPDRTASVIREGADEIASEIERHYRRWGREWTVDQWRRAVDSALVEFTAQRWTNSFEHINKFFELGGVGDLAIDSQTPGVASVIVDGQPATVSAGEWRYRGFVARPLTVTVEALPGWEFTGWQDGDFGPVRTVTLVKKDVTKLVPMLRRTSDDPVCLDGSLYTLRAESGCVDFARTGAPRMDGLSYLLAPAFVFDDTLVPAASDVVISRCGAAASDVGKAEVWTDAALKARIDARASGSVDEDAYRALWASAPLANRYWIALPVKANKKAYAGERYVRLSLKQTSDWSDRGFLTPVVAVPTVKDRTCTKRGVTTVRVEASAAPGGASGELTLGYVKGFGSYCAGESVALEAVSDSTAKFAEWVCDSDPGFFARTGVRNTAAKLSFKLTAEMVAAGPLVFRATWARLCLVDALALPAGGGTVTGSGLYLSLAKVTLKATAAKGQVFGGWFLDKACTEPAGAAYQSPSFVLPNLTGDTIVYAEFHPQAEDVAAIKLTMAEEYVTGVAIEPASVTTEGCSSLPTVKVPSPPKGLKFTPATGLITGTPTASGVYTVIATVTTAGKKTASDSALVIVRKPGEHVVCAKVESIGSSIPGKVTGSGVYAAGKKVTLKATANSGFVFYGWLDAEGGLLSQEANLPLVMTDEDRHFTARFITRDQDLESVTLAVDGRAVDPTTAFETNILCGVQVDWPVVSDGLTATTVKAANLPSGLGLVQDKLTKAYSVKGVPSAASKKDRNGNVTPSIARFSVTTAGKMTRVFTMKIVVESLPAWSYGNFAGLVRLGDAVSSATMSVSAAGKISGKFTLWGTNTTFAVNGYAKFCEDSGFVFSAPAKVGKLADTFEFLVAPYGTEAGDWSARADGASGLGFVCELFRNVWKDAGAIKPTAVSNFVFDPERYPAVKMSVKTDGSVNFSGKLPSGASVSSSTTAFPDPESHEPAAFFIVPAKSGDPGLVETVDL